MRDWFIEKYQMAATVCDYYCCCCRWKWWMCTRIDECGLPFFDFFISRHLFISKTFKNYYDRRLWLKIDSLLFPLFMCLTVKNKWRQNLKKMRRRIVVRIVQISVFFFLLSFVQLNQQRRYLFVVVFIRTFNVCWWCFCLFAVYFSCVLFNCRSNKHITNSSANERLRRQHRLWVRHPSHMHNVSLGAFKFEERQKQSKAKKNANPTIAWI